MAKKAIKIVLGSYKDMLIDTKNDAKQVKRMKRGNPYFRNVSVQHEAIIEIVINPIEDKM